MQCRFLWKNQVRTFFLVLIFIAPYMGLSGCTESVHKLTYVTDEASALPSLPPDNGLAPLQNKTAPELTSAGFAYLANKNIKIAELHFMTAINKDPKMVDAYIGLGRTEMLKGDFNAAATSFNQAEKLNPGSLPALIGQAQALRSEGKLDAAVNKINSAMMIAPQDINVLKELAMIYDLMGKENLSAPLYLEIVNKAPDEAASHNNLGLNQMVRGEYPEAILSFLQATALDRSNSRIKNNLASAYLLNGDEDNALNIFKVTVGEAQAYNNIGYLYMTQGRFDDAERSLKKALQLNPKFYVRAQDNLDILQEMRRKAQTAHQ